MTKFVLDKIKVKARWVAKHYYELKVDDLVQEGSQLVLTLEQTRGPRATIPYLLKAVDNHFGKMIRGSHAKRKIKMVGLEKIVHMPHPSALLDFQDVENAIDREKFISSIKQSGLSELANTLHDLMDGCTVKEIADKQKTSIHTIYRQLRLLKTLRQRRELGA